MIIESSVTGIKPDTSLVETVKIMDEMDRLLNEMRETMSTIKSLLDEETGVESLYSPPLDTMPLRQTQAVMSGS